MKKLLLSAIVMMPFVLTGCSSDDMDKELPVEKVYTSFLEDGKRWNYEYRAGGGVKHLYDYAYFINGDTVVDGRQCWKLYVENENRDGSVAYKCYIYEENKKVCYYPKGSQRPVVLYDFGLSVGDSFDGQSLPTGIESQTPVRMYVVAVDTINVQDIKFRRLYLDYQMSDDKQKASEIWVEGIGCRYDFFSFEGARGNPYWLSSCIIHDKTIEAKNVFAY